MKPAAQISLAAWQPFTRRGIASFARARLGRLLGLQLVMALAAAGTMAWFVQTAWCPIITAAIGRMPERGEIHGGQLDWRGAPHEVLAENRFLALTVDLEHTGEARSPAHLQLELGKSDIQIQSLLGFSRMQYRRAWVVPLNRVELVPWWGAWRPPLLALLVAGTTALLMLNWALVASLYFLPAWLVGFFANRDLSLAGGWRLCGAALMPGALLMSVGTVLYRWGTLEVIGLIVAAALHLVVGWVYVLASVLCIEKHPAVATRLGNPFTGANEEATRSSSVAELPATDPQAGPPRQA
jgi:hypothetical protein